MISSAAASGIRSPLILSSKLCLKNAALLTMAFFVSIERPRRMYVHLNMRVLLGKTDMKDLNSVGHLASLSGHEHWPLAVIGLAGP